MVSYINPVRPQAAPVRILDSYYRPLLDNTESRGLEKLAAALGNLRKPFADISRNALQAQQNQLQMMKYEQSLALQEQQNAYEIQALEQKFQLEQLTDAYNDDVEAIDSLFSQGAEIDEINQGRMANGETVFGFNGFFGSGAGQLTMGGSRLPANGPVSGSLYDILNNVARNSGLELRVSEASGTGADIQLVDLDTNTPIPLDGRDGRAESVVTQLSSLGVGSISGNAEYKNGSVLRVDMDANAGGAQWPWISGAQSRDPSEGVREFGPADVLAYQTQANAQRMALAEQYLRGKGYDDNQIDTMLAPARRQAAFELEKARNIVRENEIESEVELYKAQRKTDEEALNATIDSMSDDQILAIANSEDGIFGWVLDNMTSRGIAAGTDASIIARASSASDISALSPYTKMLSAFSDIASQRHTEIMSAFATNKLGTAVRLPEAQKADGTFDSEVLARSVQSMIDGARIKPETVMTDMISQLEVLQEKANAVGALEANVLQYNAVRLELGAAFQFGVFDSLDDTQRNRLAGLLKDEPSTTLSQMITSLGNGVAVRADGGAGTVALMQYMQSVETQMASLIGSMDVDQLQDYQAVQLRGIEAVETARAAEEANWELPVQSDFQDVSIDGVTLQFSQVDYGTPDINRQIREKQGSWITAIGPKLVGLQEGDTETMREIAAGYVTAQRNGYGEGLLARVVAEQFPEGFGAEDIPAAAALMQMSQDPAQDFKGNIEMQFYSQIKVSKDARANIAIGAQVLSRLDVDEDLTKLESAFSYLPVADRRAAAMSVLASNANVLIGTDNVGKVIDRLAKKTKPVQFIRGLDRVTPGDPLAMNMSDAFGSAVLNFSINAPDGEAQRLAAKYNMSDEQMREAVVENLPALFSSVALKDDDTDERLITDLPDNKNMTVVFAGERIYLRGKNNMPVQVKRGANGVASPAAILAVTNTTDMETGTQRVRVVDVEQQTTAEMFVVNKIDDDYTYDIGNVRGAISATVTYAQPGVPDPQTVEVPLEASSFLPITTDGTEAFAGHGAYAYMLPARALAVDGVIQSVDVQLGHSIGLNDPESLDYTAVSFSTATYFDGYRNAARYTLIEGVND